MAAVTAVFPWVALILAMSAAFAVSLAWDLLATMHFGTIATSGMGAWLWWLSILLRWRLLLAEATGLVHRQSLLVASLPCLSARL